MSRNLLPPLVAGNTIAIADPPGEWRPFEQAWTLAKQIARPAKDLQEGWSEITSIPSPWARILLFRHAMEEGDRHPLFEEVVSDVLDTLELVFFQNHLQGQCSVKRVDLAQLDRDRADRGFERALVAQAPRVPSDEGTGREDPRISTIGLVYYGDSPAASRPIALTSPFTLFVTPADKPSGIDGYFEYPRQPQARFRDLRDRDPLFVQYVREVLLPQVKARAAMNGLANYLDAQTKEMRGGADELDVEPVESLPGIGGVALHKAGALRIRSPFSLRSSRVDADSAPLVLTSALPQTTYYNHVPLPQPWVVAGDVPRDRLPGTHVRHPWIHPEEDFLEPVLLRMPAELQGVVRDRKASSETARYLLPLTPKFFEYFSPDQVPEIVSVTANLYGVVAVQLEIPVRGGNGVARTLTVKRTYQPREESRGLDGTFLSLWPNFDTEGWRDYYLLHFEYGRAAEKVGRVEFYSDLGRLHPPAQRRSDGSLGDGVDRVMRESSTAAYHTTSVPRVIRFVRAEDGAAGVLLPELANRKGPFQEQTTWEVGIDFGTSNTIIALKEAGQGNAPEVVRLGDATRLDFCGAAEGAQAEIWEGTLKYFFFPRDVDPALFASQIFWRTDARRDLPGLHANIPFSGALSSDPGNRLLTNLKWSDDAHANHLTRLFLQQVTLMVRAEAIARAIPPESISYRWSYPMAFTENKRNLFRSMWEGVVGSDTASDDESTCALLFFRDRSPDFTPDATAAKVTVDIGGGTSDIACYSRGRAVFRDSIFFGGRELTGSDHTEAEGKVLNPFVRRLIDYAEANGFDESTVLARYNSSHSKFSYLVKTAWFRKKRGEIAAQSWFEEFQCAVLYFYSALLYYVGLRLRAAELDRLQHPNIVFFGGNGSRYLDWLTAFAPWPSASRQKFLEAFAAMLEAGCTAGTETGNRAPSRLEVRSSSAPKHEVALGLLLSKGELNLENHHTGAVLGEDVRFVDGETANATARSDDTGLAREKALAMEFAAPLGAREIDRLNEAYLAQLQQVRYSDGAMRRARERLAQLDETFFGDAVKARLSRYFDLEKDQVFNGSLLMLEAAACLQELL